MSAARRADVPSAARNNAAWCEAICSTHGSPGEWTAGYWLTRAPAPPYYPNLVTLAPVVQPVLGALEALEPRGPSGSFAVKDSFGILPLGARGYEVLLEAAWIARDARPSSPSPGRHWIRVGSEDELAAWEAAWGESLGQPRIFLPAVLRRPELAILAALDAGGAIVAGVVVNRSDDGAGVTNFFARHDRAAFRSESVTAAAAAFPGLPLLGYESGRDLADCEALGFQRLGTLRVWQAPGSPTPVPR